MNPMLLVIIQVFYVSFFIVFFVYLLFISPRIYRSTINHKKIILEDIKLYLKSNSKKDLYNKTEKGNNFITNSIINISDFIEFQLKEDPKKYLIILFFIIIGIVAIYYILK